MPYLTQLAAVARRTGYPVTECAGWKTRGHGPQPAVRGIVCHHTAGWGDMHVVRDGRPGLDGPLSQIWLRKDGAIFVVAAGKCWHNAPSTSANHTNSNAIGIEAENDGRTPWPDVQVDAYLRLCAELCKEFGLTASRVKGHKEVQPGKPDPHTIDMGTFRAEVALLMTGVDPSPASATSWTEELVKDLPLLQLGDDNYDVKSARAWMFARGRVPAAVYAECGLKAWLERTKFDEEFDGIVRNFQRSEQLDDDGRIGKDTWTALARLS
jgi:hypothetical protein